MTQVWWSLAAENTGRHQHSYPAQATKQPFSGTALLSSNEEGERKGSLNNARSVSLLSRYLDSGRNQQKLQLASWNVWTLLDNGELQERRTAIIAQELSWYNIDIAALHEMRPAGECQLEEVGAGYKFFCMGHLEGQARQAGIGFYSRVPRTSPWRSSSGTGNGWYQQHNSQQTQSYSNR